MLYVTQQTLKLTVVTNSITTRKLDFASTLQRAGSKAFRGGISGAIAGVIQVITLMWLRTTVNYQYSYGVSMIQAMRELYEQGGLVRFYRGLLYAIMQGPLARFGAIAANDASIVLVAHFLKQSEKVSKGTFLTTAVGSILVGLWRILLMPIDTCKTILQVDGGKGFQQLMHRVSIGEFSALFNGATATLVATIVGYYPWFYVFHAFDRHLPVVTDPPRILFRSALIGFIATTVSDTISNSVRIVKTVKQASTSAIGNDLDSYKGSSSSDNQNSYLSIIHRVYSEGGLHGLFGRGLLTRILTNGIQNMLFTVIWKYLNMRQQKNKKSIYKRKAAAL